MTAAERFAQCKALAEAGTVITDDDLARFKQEVAREYARAEQRREPIPQQGLPL